MIILLILPEKADGLEESKGIVKRNSVFLIVNGETTSQSGEDQLYTRSWPLLDLDSDYIVETKFFGI